MPDDKEQFDRLAALIQEALLSASDEEILTEAREHGIDPDAEMDAFRNEIQAIAREQGKKDFATGRHATPVTPLLPRTGGSSAGTAQERLDALRRRVNLPLSQAARDGRNMSERDKESLIEDLEELEREHRDTEE